jgi:hypothetical protein
MRVVAFAVGLLALVGCTLTQGIPSPAAGPTSLADVPDAQPKDREDKEDPVVPPAQSVPAEPDTLTLTAECLERGDRANAAIHLECYVCRHPEQWMFRAQLAEMLLALGRDAPARAHYERFIADVAPTAGPLRGQVVNAHTRLMEIAQRADDRFGELFHRGVGLLLLAREQEKLPSREADPAFAEEMICKALVALREAKELKPSDARMRAYLAEALERCGNHRAADAERVGVRSTLVPGRLTAAERESCLKAPTLR